MLAKLREEVLSTTPYKMRWTLQYVCVLCIIGSAFSNTDCDANQNNAWSYSGANGPENWKNTYPACEGRNQSPININTSPESCESTTAKEISTFGYDQPIAGDLVNLGYTVEVIPKDQVKRGVQIAGVTYNLQQFHFHFGTRANNGSEHRFNNEGYAMEVHLVHKNGNDELAVVGILFQEGVQDNKAMNPITEKLSEIKYKNQRTKVQNIELANLIPACTQPTFYRYSGSLTTPNCAEGVRWFVLSSLQNISTDQMRQFRRVYSTTKEQGKCPMASNFRPVQDLNGRVVTANSGECFGQ